MHFQYEALDTKGNMINQSSLGKIYTFQEVRKIKKYNSQLGKNSSTDSIFLRLTK